MARALLVGVLLLGALLRVWYAAYGLDEGRFWDERYNFENVASILETGSLTPAKVYYPSPLVSWPQAGLLAASAALADWTGSPAFAIRDQAGFTPTAYLICRLLSVVYGVASLWMLYLLGRALFDRKVALLATLMLAFLPWHIHASGKFKPDALVVLTVLAACYWSLGAVRRPTVRRHLLAGIGIALALSSKLTGGVVAVPLAVGSLVAGGDRLRRLGLLALAGAVSLGAFLALNPYGRWYLQFLSGLQRDYAMRAGWQEGGPGPIPIETLRYLVGPYVHGPLIGVLALVGGVVLTIGLFRRGLGPVERAGRAMLVVFPVAFTAAYTLATPYFKGNNFLPIVPFTCLMAAWAALPAWRWLEPKLSGAGRPIGGAAMVVAALVLIAVVRPGLLYVYRSLTPTGIDRARQIAVDERRAPAGRFYYLEEGEAPEPPWEGRDDLNRRHPGFLVVPDLSALGEQEVARADGAVFPRARLDGDAALFYRDLLQRAGPERRWGLEPELFVARAPAAVAVVHRWSPLGDWRPAHLGRCKPGRNCFLSARPRELAPGTLVSLLVDLPAAALDPRQDELGLDVGGRALDSVRVVISGPRRAFLSERFELEADELEIRLTDLEPRLLRRDLDFRLFAWGRAPRRGGAPR